MGPHRAVRIWVRTIVCNKTVCRCAVCPSFVAASLTPVQETANKETSIEYRCLTSWGVPVKG